MSKEPTGKPLELKMDAAEVTAVLEKYAEQFKQDGEDLKASIAEMVDGKVKEIADAANAFIKEGERRLADMEDRMNALTAPPPVDSAPAAASSAPDGSVQARLAALEEKVNRHGHKLHAM